MHISGRSQMCVLLLTVVCVSGYSYVLQPKETPAGPGGEEAGHLRERTTILSQEENRKEEQQQQQPPRGYDVVPRSYKEQRELEREERESNLVAGMHLQEERRGEAAREEETEVGLSPPSRVPPQSSFHGPLPPTSPSTALPATFRGRGLAESPDATEDPPPPRLEQTAVKVHDVVPAVVASTGGGPVKPVSEEQSGGEDFPVKDPTATSASTQSTPRPMDPSAAVAPPKPTPKSPPPKSRGQPKGSSPTEKRKTVEPTVAQNQASPAKPTAAPPPPPPPPTRPAANAKTVRRARLNAGGKTKRNKTKSSTPKAKPAKGKNGNKTTPIPTKTAAVTATTAYFPYFKDSYCPLECACFGGVVQCSDKGVDKVPYGIPDGARYILLMNNRIDRLQSDAFRQYLHLEFLVLSNNRLADGAVAGAFAGVRALKRLYLDRNLLGSVPADLPASLEELRLDNNGVRATSEAAWVRCPGLLVLSLSNNSLGDGPGGLPAGALLPLGRLRTLSLDGNRLASVPLGLPPSVRELYLRGNHIRRFRRGVFAGPSQLTILDLSGNRLTDKGLAGDSLLNATRLESLNLEGNALGRVPRRLPPSLKTLNLEGNLISSVGRSAFRSLPNLEHLGMARNKIFAVAPGAFGTLASLHQLDLCHNALRQVPRRLPPGLHSAALAHNRIRTVPLDAFCQGEGAAAGTPSRLAQVQLEHNLIDLGKVDARAFRCLRGSQVVQFY